MNAIIRMQFDLYERIARLNENIKKSSFANITIGIVQARLEAVEAYWAKFKTQHDKLVATSWEDLSGHDYLKKNIYALTEEYLSQKAMFLDVLRILKSKASVEAPAAGANLFQPPRIILPQFSGLYENGPSFPDYENELRSHISRFTAIQKLKDKSAANLRKLYHSVMSTIASERILLSISNTTESLPYSQFGPLARILAD